MSDRNVNTVQDVFGAFGRGDIPAILERVADDTHWASTPLTPISHGMCRPRARLNYRTSFRLWETTCSFSASSPPSSSILATT